MPKEVGLLGASLPEPLGLSVPAGEGCAYSLGGAAVAALAWGGQWGPWLEAVDVVASFPGLREQLSPGNNSSSRFWSSSHGPDPVL